MMDLRIKSLLPFPHGHQYWFTADTHFGHTKIIEHCNRPFSSAEEMDQVILDNVNDKVGETDSLFILGDFASWYDFPPEIGNVLDNYRYYRSKIRCKNVILVNGNHDPHHSNYLPRQELNHVFNAVAPIWMVKADGVRIFLHHYAMRVWPGSHRQFSMHPDVGLVPRPCWHLFGHSHGNLPDDPHSLSFDVGVDCHNFSPINLNDVANIMFTKDWIGPKNDSED